MLEVNQSKVMLFKSELEGEMVKPDWIQVFSHKVALHNNFNITELYNLNRQTASLSEMYFLDRCFMQGLFDIHKFEINPVLSTEDDDWKESSEIRSLRGYSNENYFIIESLWNLIQVIKQSGFDVLVREVEDSIPSYVRAYVPAWKLMISPSTQSILDILHMLSHKEEKVCIVTYEVYGYRTKVIAYVIESKWKFHEEYKAFLRQKELDKAATIRVYY